MRRLARAASIRCVRAQRCPAYLRPRLSLPSRLMRSRTYQRPRRHLRRDLSQPRRDLERDERTMRSVNTLVVGILLATGAPCVLAQAPAAGSAKTAQPAAKAATKGGAKS